MKKLTGIVCLLALMLTLTACAGAGDWKYEDLPGDYAVWRINSQEIPLVCVDDDGLTAEPVVEGYVYAAAWDESTIYVQQRAEKDKGDMAYYAVALDSGQRPLYRDGVCRGLREAGRGRGQYWLAGAERLEQGL